MEICWCKYFPEVQFPGDREAPERVYLNVAGLQFAGAEVVRTGK